MEQHQQKQTSLNYLRPEHVLGVTHNFLFEWEIKSVAEASKVKRKQKKTKKNFI